MSKAEWIEKVNMLHDLKADPIWILVSLVFHMFHFLIEWKYEN